MENCAVSEKSSKCRFWVEKLVEFYRRQGWWKVGKNPKTNGRKPVDKQTE